MSLEKLETVGTVSKKETLASIDLDNCRALILENFEPFPGYHGLNLLKDTHPGSLFMVTKLMYNDEKIIRAIQYIKSQTDHPEFDGTPGTINLYNTPTGVIRIKGLEYNKVALLVELFEDAGIEFKKKKKVSPYQSIIKIRKFFKLHLIDEGIYQDDTIKEMHYLVIPKALRWNSFEKITMEIKYNIEDNNYDAALVTVFYENGLLDMVRIFDQNSSIEKLKTIRKKYLEKIN
jgi:hypothetical protein